MGLFTSLLCIILFAVFILIALKAAPFGSEDNDGLHLAKDRKKR